MTLDLVYFYLRCERHAQEYILSASGSVVERLLAKEKAAGSIPVSRSGQEKGDTQRVNVIKLRHYLKGIAFFLISSLILGLKILSTAI